uniref:RING-type domain-containing protein n=1 Tax=viral metagenome TaxID=1070528 RepID=A0A6C0KZL5_9ZZZZ|tara:strand:+ start:16330 stop:16875 length:546 start_codon:yes stop_codon:yes gene_type:complete
MELGYSFSLSFEDLQLGSPFGLNFLNNSRNEMISSVETEFRNLIINQTTNVISNENEERISRMSTENFKERIRELLEDFLSYVQFHVTIMSRAKQQEIKLSNQDYNKYIVSRKGSVKLAKKLDQHNEQRLCPICLEPLLLKRMWHSPHCDHLFHPKCLKYYLTKKCKKPLCPVCRTDVKTD